MKRGNRGATADVRDIDAERLIKAVFTRLGHRSAKVTQWFSHEDYEYLTRLSYQLARENGWPRASLFRTFGYVMKLPSYLSWLEKQRLRDEGKLRTSPRVTQKRRAA